MEFKKQPIYSLSKKLPEEKKVNYKNTFLMALIICAALYELLTIICLQNAIVFASDSQQAKVEAMLEEPVIEDYSDSLRAIEGFQFGELLKRDLGIELVGDYNDYQRKWMQYAWQISHDKEFLYMLKGENGLLNHDRKSLVPGEPSYGFCQIHQGFHPEIVNDSRFWSDPAWQLNQCYKLWKGGTVFYAYERIKRDPAYRASIESHFKFYEGI